MALAGLGLIFIPRASASAGSTTSPKAKGLQVLAFNDESGSHALADQRKGFGVLDALVDEVLPPNSNVRLYEFDTKLRLFYDGVPSKSQDLWAPEDRMTAERDSKTGGTWASTALDEATRIARSTHGTVLAILLWDGGHDGPAQYLTASLNEAAKQKNLIVWVCGAKTEQGLYAKAKRDFEGTLPKACVTGPSDAQTGLSYVSETIRKEVSR